jgi:uncharacterized membrane protein YjjP (DUF1212 family)
MTQQLEGEIEQFLTELCSSYQQFGCPTHTNEVNMKRVARGLGIDADFTIMPSYSIMTVRKIKTTSGMMKQHTVSFPSSSGFDFYKLQLVDELAMRISTFINFS